MQPKKTPVDESKPVPVISGSGATVNGSAPAAAGGAVVTPVK